MDDRRVGYRDQWDADVQTGRCPLCGTYIGNLGRGDGGRCPLCYPPTYSYRFACGATLVTDDDPYCPEHEGRCRVVARERLRPPYREP
jgi:hypothetical protein